MKLSRVAWLNTLTAHVLMLSDPRADFTPFQLSYIFMTKVSTVLSIEGTKDNVHTACDVYYDIYRIIIIVVCG